MDPNPTSTFIMLIVGASAFIFIMLLPALLELKRPKDSGPRRIMPDVHIGQFYTKANVPVANIDEEGKFSRILVEKIAEVIAVLPNLEA